jgi:AraC family transcriptional regulator
VSSSDPQRSRNEQSYLDWLGGSHLSPFLRTVRPAGANGQILELHQPAGDMSDAPVSDLLIGLAITDIHGGVVNLGAGPFDARFPAGGVWVTPPDTATEIEIASAHRISVWAIPGARVVPLLKELRPQQPAVDFGALHRGPQHMPVVRSLITQLASRDTVNCRAGRLFADAALMMTVAELCLAAERRLAPTPKGALAPWQVARVTEYLRDHLADDVGLDELAALVGLSVYHFCRAFKVSTGLPPHRWRLARRMERAQELLTATSQDVTSIGAAVGYEDSAHFASAFRRHVGCSPTLFRAQLQR